VRDANDFLNPDLSRRQLLRSAVLGAAVLLPGWRVAARSEQGGAAAAALQPFLSSDELALLDAVVARIIPTDSLPGAREAGVSSYVQGLLSALPPPDANCDGRRGAADFTAIVLQRGAVVPDGCPHADLNEDGTIDTADAVSAELALFEAQPLFAGGPFSGRQPFGDFETGTVTDRVPANHFADFVPLTRLQRMAWTVRLDGADAVPEVTSNPLATSLPDVDLRRKYRDGLRAIRDVSQLRFQQAFPLLSATQQDAVLAAVDAAFVNLVTGHVLEGFLCVPEYGGNRARIGWQLIGFDGDSQPLGYTLGFDETAQQYIERPDKPNSKADPDDPCANFSPKVAAFLGTIARAEFTRPGNLFRTPYCFEVPA